MIQIGRSKCYRTLVMARLFSVALGALIVSPAWGQSPQAARTEKGPSDVVSLRVIGRELSRSLNGGMEAVYRLVNDSEKTIVAWEFGCVTALQGGGPGLRGSIGTDAYFDYERSRSEPLSAPTEVIESGSSFEQRIAFSENELDGPMAGKTCGPIALIFADTSYEGLETVAAFWYRKRAQTAIDARLAYRALESRLESGSPLVDTLGRLAGELARPVNTERGVGFGADTFAMAREQILRGRSISADQILADLDFRFQAALKHLPKVWQEKVIAEVER